MWFIPPLHLISPFICSIMWFTSPLHLLFPFVGVSLAQPYVGTYNLTNDTCPYGSLLGQSFKGIGSICPLGHYCPEGSITPTACPAGSYSNRTGQSACLVCPAGYYCPETTGSFMNNICPSGYYCPANTTHPYQYPCSPGTFNNRTGQQSQLSCRACPAGEYCENYGLSSPTGYCSPGWYCNGSSTVSKTLVHGGRCLAGYYCTMGSAEPLPCPRGKYCASNELSSPTGNCSAGYYCNLRSQVPNPVGTSQGDECPRGYYCPEGTVSAIPCNPGYFLDSKLSKNASFCKMCTAGKYCNGSGLPAPTGDCSPGYYCTPGQSSSTAISCPQGFYCVGGKGHAEPCLSGTYQDQLAQSTCKTCPEQYYCNATFGPVVNYALYICPAGHYCPNGTKFSTEYPCDIGTFNNVTGLARQAECSPCIGGYYCGQKGLVYPNTECSSGYFCKSGTNLSICNVVLRT